jgi:hypothetical protein
VFVAEVLDQTTYRREDEQGRPYPESIRQYRFKIIEAIKGIKTGEWWALFYAGLDLDSFRLGGRYLIFANQRPTGAFTSGCSYTRELRGLEDETWSRGVMLELSVCFKTVP